MRHIYVHVPFCARRCSYCDFSIAVRKSIPADQFVSAITDELEIRRSQNQWDESPTETLYFGGGTPSLLPPEHLGSLIRMLAVGSPEVTIEANPDDVTPEVARAWSEAGVSRISLGVQSFDPGVLRWMHRTHEADAAGQAVAALRAVGIEDVSLDLIFGLPEELGSDFERDLSSALALHPTHLSAYGLSVESRTPLARWISRGATSQPSDERYVREFLLADRVLSQAGFEHYEVSNYGLPGQHSRHNSAYWSEHPYVGLGPAAHSFSGGERRWNTAAWAEYERLLSQGLDPAADREVLTGEQRRIERLYLGLRTSAGVSDDEWPAPGPAREESWLTHGWLVRRNGRYCLTPEGWLRLDEIVAVLTTSAVGG